MIWFLFFFSYPPVANVTTSFFPKLLIFHKKWLLCSIKLAWFSVHRFFFIEETAWNPNFHYLNINNFLVLRLVVRKRRSIVLRLVNAICSFPFLKSNRCCRFYDRCRKLDRIEVDISFDIHETGIHSSSV